jgi:putative hydrolase
MKNIELDVHTHTLASGHAYGTIMEMARAAHEKGLKLLGITEHTKGIPGTCEDTYFSNLEAVPRKLCGIDLLLGAEINIIDYQGTLGLEDKFVRELDFRIAGLHDKCYKSGTARENTEALLGAIRNSRIDMISHPGGGGERLIVIFDPIVHAAKEYHTLLEVNNNALRGENGKAYREGVLEMLELCKEYKQPVVISSDAHFMTDIANFDHAMPIIEEAGFPDELIMNYSMDKFLDYIRENKQHREC